MYTETHCIDCVSTLGTFRKQSEKGKMGDR